jgi:hypothetical protein
MKKSKRSLENNNTELSNSEGIIGMLIDLHTFPLESDEDLAEKKKIVTEIQEHLKTTEE